MIALAKPEQPPLRLPSWVPVAAGVAVVAAANAWAIPHLAGRWNAEAPTRAERALRDAERRAAEAEARRAEEEQPQVPVAVPGPDGTTVIHTADLPETPGLSPEEAAQLRAILARNRTGRLTPEETQALNRLLGARRPAVETRPSPTTPTSSPLVWRVAPSIRVRASDLPAGSNGGSVRWSCDALPSGRLTGCQATESPAGNGLADISRAAMDRAEVEPTYVNGRPVGSRISVSFSYTPPFQMERPAPAPVDTGPSSPVPFRDKGAPIERILPPSTLPDPVSTPGG